MTDIKITQQDESQNGKSLYTLNIDGTAFAKNLTKVDVMMTIWSHLQLPAEFWSSVKEELAKLD